MRFVWTVLGGLRGPRLLVFLAVGGLLWGSRPPGASGQVVQGRVLDARTETPVATARVTLLDARGEAVETLLTDSEGRFSFWARRSGMHRIEADRLGYGTQRTDSFHVESEGITHRDVRLEPRAVELEGLTARVYPGALLHQPTLSGVFARRARSPSVGGNRVLVRGDPDFDAALRVRDLLPPGLPRLTCPRLGERGTPVPYLYMDGWAEPREEDDTDWVLDLPISFFQAIEFYRQVTSAPMPFRPEPTRFPNAPEPIRTCGIVVLWSRAAPR